ncbi:aspartate/glutamate racemase family protein [Roseivirga sp. BDSF3-8]|uniref:aspartate/glutamate racemase family protein n=1 Tax=Roseivirga sp. BDSF3-8 TaxID=3241598 RepID=UPI0035324CB9
MKTEKEKTIGIVGGMGPQAGADLLHEVTRLTPASKDQDHRDVILMSFPSHITDRTAYFEGYSAVNPAYAISEILLRLEKAGAGVAGLACNSSHIPAIFEVILDQLQKHRSSLKLLNMPDETCRHIREQFPHITKVGVLSTTGTYKAGTYYRQLEGCGLQPILPSLTFQQEVVHRMIYDETYGIKACATGITDKVYNWLDEALTYFKDAGAEAIILGCTEFNLVLKDPEVMGMKVINSNAALARALVRETETIEEPAHKNLKSGFSIGL